MLTVADDPSDQGQLQGQETSTPCGQRLLMELLDKQIPYMNTGAVQSTMYFLTERAAAIGR